MEQVDVAEKWNVHMMLYGLLARNKALYKWRVNDRRSERYAGSQ